MRTFLFFYVINKVHILLCGSIPPAQFGLLPAAQQHLCTNLCNIPNDLKLLLCGLVHLPNLGKPTILAISYVIAPDLSLIQAGN